VVGGRVPCGARAERVCSETTSKPEPTVKRDWVSPDIDYIKACPDLPVAPD
jgi:hypothetical protein